MDDQLKTHSSSLIDELMEHGVTYTSLTLLDAEGKSYYSKCSDDKWFNIYIESNLYQKCHLMQEACLQVKNHLRGFIFLWDKYFPGNEESLYLDHLRQEKNFAHGVAFCTPLENEKKLILTVTGKYHDINFAQNVLRNKQKLYQAIMHSLHSTAINNH